MEPRGADAMSRSIAQGSPERLTEIKTVADGLAAPFAGVHTPCPLSEGLLTTLFWCQTRRYWVQWWSVMERCKLVVEPAAAACIAALITSGKISLRSRLHRCVHHQRR